MRWITTGTLLGILACGASPGTSAEGNATGADGGTTTGDGATVADSSTSGELQPLNLAFTFHLEGQSLVASQTAFDRYVENMRATAAIFHRYAAHPTWEAAELVEKIAKGTLTPNILKELENGGDAIGLHANGAGYVPNDPNYSVDKMEAELKRQKGYVDSLGLTVRHVSNICSSIDWVTAVRRANFEAVTGVITFCLKSLSAPPAEATSCASPDKCHSAYPAETVEQISSWYAESGANWTTPATSGLMVVPTAGALPCAYEESLPDAGAPTRCGYGEDDATTALGYVEQAVGARTPGKVHSYVFVASFGQTPDAQVFESLLSQIKAKYIDTGKARWTTVPGIIDLNKAAK
jgi:hypothetical protein